MTELQKTYLPEGVENKWYAEWLRHRFFHSEPDGREPYTIVIPPPNVTGVLHMGHALNNTVQDILIRRARLQGKNALWVPGTDHASIATEAKVVALLKEKGIAKSSLTRDEFLAHAIEWKNKYGGIILEQLKRLGASCDWDRVTFTMDPDYYASVIKVFIDLFDKGYIYRGSRIVDWDPQAKTALSDEEVKHEERRSNLYYIRYKIKGEDTYITLATTRPETMLGDTAICVHPEDERYKSLHGKTAIVPLINREVPIITDTYVEQEFGTGALKVTPAHDRNDYELGNKHKLKFINIFNEDGSLNEEAEIFIGKDRFEARKLVVKALEENEDLVKIEQINNKIGLSERTNAVIEPRVSKQWFLKMDAMAKPAIDAVANDEVKFFPSKFKNMYRIWMEGIHDWCISRQLWWGHRIPVYYIDNERYVVAASNDEAVEKARAVTGNANLQITDLKQDEDVLDTWFSSWLWPEAVFNGILEPDNADIKYYYPTQSLITAPEIIFFWVARMIMAGFEYRKQIPFENVYFTGIVRDDKGRKMSKSLGNSPDILELFDKYGADAVRFGVLISSPAGNDLLYDEKQLEQGRNFNNKIWNALRLVKGWADSGRINYDDSTTGNDNNAIQWFENTVRIRFNEIENYFKEFRVSDCLHVLYKLIWDDFCSWYLEFIKPGQDKQIPAGTYNQTIVFFETLMQMLHPFMPFITEEVWQTLKDRNGKDYIIVSEYPKMGIADENLIKESEKVLNLISSIRHYRSELGMSPKEAISISLKANNKQVYDDWQDKITKLANISEINFTTIAPENCKLVVINGDELYLPKPLVENAAAEREKMEKELEYARGFLNSVMVKLNNERFVQNAKTELLEKERQKKEDAEAKIKILEEELGKMN